jgi:hypothetical protein
MRVGIVQSNYLPWRGYFDLIDDCDLFVFLDDVQYTPRDWRNRNLIKTSSGTAWLTVPVEHDRETLIQDARIDYSKRWIDKHVKTLTQAYAKAPFFESYSPALFSILRSRPDTISRLNVQTCTWIMSALGINTKTAMSAELAPNGAKDDKLLAILRATNAQSYLSGPTAKSYIDPGKFRSAGIKLEYKRYAYPEYQQLHGAFIAKVSAVDLLFNCGPGSRAYLKSQEQKELVD